MSTERGRAWELAALDAIALCMQLVDAADQLARTETDPRERGRMWRTLKAVAGRLVDVVEHEPGPEHLDEERVHVIGPQLAQLGERIVAAMQLLASEPGPPS